MKTKRIVTVLLVFWFTVQLASAAPTIREQAETVVRNFLTLDESPLEAQISAEISETKTYYDETGEQPLYHIVSLHPEGFFIISAEDRVEPVIGFSTSGKYNPSTRNPMGALVSKDLSARISAVEKPELDPNNENRRRAVSRNTRKWQTLLAPVSAIDGGLTGISDPRVSPLIESKWNQGSVSGNYCYNYYTPNHYPCGCIATAMAQLMRYHEHPASGVGTPTFEIGVDGAQENRQLRGGDGNGGPYDWSLMVLNPNASSTEDQREAIGALTHDAGVSVGMQYYPGFGSANNEDASLRLKDTFQFNNSIYFRYNDASQIETDKLIKMINPNLDAGFPVLLGISSPGHAIVADGYGYHSSTLYHHLNMGWSGLDDAWYNLPDIPATFYTFTIIDECVFNIFVSGTGEIISGRVTDQSDSPLSGVQITATRTGGGTYFSTTNERGIYALAGIPSNSQYTISAVKTGYSFTDQTVSTEESISWGWFNPSIGNRWGVDFDGSPVTGDDDYEPNNTMQEAYDLTQEERIWISDINGYCIQADDDWFKIEVTPGFEIVWIDCRFSHAAGDIDIQLYDASGNLLEDSRTVTDDELIGYWVSGPGTYYIRVFYDNAGNTYDLWWDDFVAYGNINGSSDVDMLDADMALEILTHQPVGTVWMGAEVAGDDQIGLEEPIYILQTIHFD